MSEKIPTLGSCKITKEKVHDIGFTMNNIKLIIHCSNIFLFFTEELKKPYYKEQGIFNIDQLLNRFLLQLGYAINNKIKDFLYDSKEFSSKDE